MFFRDIEQLRDNGLFRAVSDRSSPQGSRIRLNGRELINFASNDYLGLAGHPEVVRAAQSACEGFGFGSGASRLLGGGSSVHARLEKEIAVFKHTAASLIFNSGYAANTGIIPAISGAEDVIFSDELNHASIVDGCRLSRAKTAIYRHKDVTHLSELIKKVGGKKKIIITDTVFSMDGDIAPLKEICNLCSSLNSELPDHDSVFLYLDDAHGTGVLGSGRGGLTHFNIEPEPWIIQTGTFSKALGSFGAFVAGTKDLIEWLTNTARSFIFSTALPASTAAASSKALELVRSDSSLIKSVWENRSFLIKALHEKEFNTGESETPIIPLKTETIDRAVSLSRYLYEKGIFAPAIRPPTVKEPRLRMTVTAAHSEEDMRSLVKELSNFRELRMVP